ncbi:hypothetical protein DFH27DRAFT_655494 [Peziza echinospora]|nr:hypothetical protein DFH27DRAFT_655494 [Peziza echinospora]
MKLLTCNFLSCPLKSCRSSPLSFPLHFKDAELAQDTELEYNSEVLDNLLKRVEWDALVVSAGEIGFVGLEKPQVLLDEDEEEEEDDEDEDDDDDEGMEVDAMGNSGKKGGSVKKGGNGKVSEEEKLRDEEVRRKLWEVVMQTQVVSGKLVCKCCGYEFEIREGIVNFLLPGHLVDG